MEIISMEDFVLQENNRIDDVIKKEEWFRTKSVQNPNPQMRDTPLGRLGGAIVLSSSVEIKNSLGKFVAYAKFLKTPMTWEHFNGPEAIVKIEGMGVLKKVNGSTNEDMPGLLFVGREDEDDRTANTL